MYGVAIQPTSSVGVRKTGVTHCLTPPCPPCHCSMYHSPITCNPMALFQYRLIWLPDLPSAPPPPSPPYTHTCTAVHQNCCPLVLGFVCRTQVSDNKIGRNWKVLAWEVVGRYGTHNGRVRRACRLPRARSPRSTSWEPYHCFGPPCSSALFSSFSCRVCKAFWRRGLFQEMLGNHDFSTFELSCRPNIHPTSTHCRTGINQITLWGLS